MPNLDNIFNKFFPQSQTTKKGIFLLRMAWGVEILVAFIGLCVGILIIRGAQGVADVTDLASMGVSLNDLTIGVPVILGANGVEKIVEIDLDQNEKELLNLSAKGVKSTNDLLNDMDVF